MVLLRMSEVNSYFCDLSLGLDGCDFQYWDDVADMTNYADPVLGDEGPLEADTTYITGK